ncbi:MAG: hypothetical protein JSV85_01860 [Candidatus Bathyarchaeota archaeon]|nr:MAG: hypothetical protein JSV85_01860 [Candidatus Bathyarchaeota archaeon]
MGSRREKGKREFLARQEGKNYYRPLYGRIAMLHELALAYPRSLEAGETEVFSKKADGIFLVTELKLPEVKQKLQIEFYQDNNPQNSRTYVSIKESGLNPLDEKTLQWAKPTSFLRFLGDVWKHK